MMSTFAKKNYIIQLVQFWKTGLQIPKYKKGFEGIVGLSFIKGRFCVDWLGIAFLATSK